MHLALQSFTFLTGVLSYVLYFSRGEHHLYGLTYIKYHTIAFLGLTALLYRLGLPLGEAASATFTFDAIFFGGLYTSLVLYRAFLNPLNAYAGPWMARITSFYFPLRIRKRQMYKKLEQLHGKYGYFVRIGTGELSITHPTAVQEIFGADSVCEKSIWYDISRPQDSLLLRRTYEGHAELRSVWSHAFSVKAVKGYELRMQPYRNKLLANLDGYAGEAVDVGHMLALYSWDVLSDLSFGHAFGMLNQNDKHWAIQILKKGMSVVGLHLPMWWLRIGVALPGGREDMKQMLKYCTGEMMSRWEVSFFFLFLFNYFNILLLI